MPKIRKRIPLGKVSLATIYEKSRGVTVFARSREPTIMRLPSQPTVSPNEKRRPKASIRLVEVVGIEPTSYSAAKKLSTYLVYLLFLNT